MLALFFESCRLIARVCPCFSLSQEVSMVLVVVQWENEDSISVVNEKQVAGNVDLKEGASVDISTGSHKGRLAIYKAAILKVFGESELQEKASIEEGGKHDRAEEPPTKKKRSKPKKQKGDDEEDKKENLERRKLQESVQKAGEEATRAAQEIG